MDFRRYVTIREALGAAALVCTALWALMVHGDASQRDALVAHAANHHTDQVDVKTFDLFASNLNNTLNQIREELVVLRQLHTGEHL